MKIDKGQPTEAQFKVFWRWYGFRLATKEEISKGCTVGFWWRYPEAYIKPDLPPLDLNNLFRWVMSRLDQARYYEVLRSIFLKQEDPALALFWALWQVKEATDD